MSRQRFARSLCGLLQQCSSGSKSQPLMSAAAALTQNSQLAHHQSIIMRATAAFCRNLTTSSPAHSGLGGLLREEIKYEKENYQRPEQVSGGPPAPFKLTETPGDTLLSLSRTFNGEEINVDLHANNQPSPPYEGEEGDEEGVTTVVFNVSVSQGSKSLVFECESDGNSVNINHVSLEPKEGFGSESMYTGPVFDELDDNLQRQFQSYLEERGITAEIGEYLRFLMYDKEQREYLNWLTEVEKFTGSK